MALLIFRSSKAPWPWPWIGSRSYKHAQYLLYYQHAQPSDCSLMHYQNMAIWITWNIDIPQSLNSRDSFPRRKFENQAPTSCRPGAILWLSTISFELSESSGGDIPRNVQLWAIVESSNAPWPWPWIGSRSHQHTQYVRVGLPARPTMWL